MRRLQKNGLCTLETPSLDLLAPRSPYCASPNQKDSGLE